MRLTGGFAGLDRVWFQVTRAATSTGSKALLETRGRPSLFPARLFSPDRRMGHRERWWLTRPMVTDVQDTCHEIPVSPVGRLRVVGAGPVVSRCLEGGNLRSQEVAVAVEHE